MGSYVTVGLWIDCLLVARVVQSFPWSMQKYKTGDFIQMRHDDPTTFWAKYLYEAHRDVEIQPALLPLSGETFPHRTANTQQDARSDLRVRGFWTYGSNAFFDTKVFFYPHASSYWSRSQ